MLPAGEEADVDVTWEDQQMINTFGRLTARRHEVEAEMKLKQDQITNTEDAKTEIIMVDGDTVPYRLGEGFAVMPKEEAESRLEKELDGMQKDLDRLRGEHDKIGKTLSELKLKLYGKFKNQINLDE